MSTTEPHDEMETEPVTKKRALESRRSRKEAEQLEATLEAKLEAKFDARFNKLEELIITSFKKIEAKFEFIEQTLRPIVRHPTFAPMFVNHPYNQEQQQPFTLTQSWPPTQQQQ